jgi:hypothetical protein
MLTILQVVIGISFVFLLFSLIVSAANELLQAIFSVRARYLKAGIGELLQDRDFRNAAKVFCNHPLISCLSKGRDGQPSYIPPATFVTTVLDLIRNGEIVTDALKGADLAVQIAKIENPALQRALRALFDQAGQDATEFEKALETWFNVAMDRVSGWYKRWIQYWLFGFGLVLAAGANVDALHIIGALSTDPKLRSATAKSAIDYLQTLSRTGQSLSGSTENRMASPNPSPEVSPQGGTTPGGSTVSQGTPSGSEQLLEQAATDLASLEVPLGWVDPERTYVGHHWWSAVMGWLLTGLAGSMGAPFWFDTLNRFVNVRAAGRAPDENPKGEKLAAPQGEST